MSSASTNKFTGSADDLVRYYTNQLVKYYLGPAADRPGFEYANVLASDDFYNALGIEKERMKEPEYLAEVLGRLCAGKNKEGAYLSDNFANNRSMIAEDVTLSPPKSVSAVFAISDQETRDKIETAHRAAVAAAQAKIKADLSYSRRGKKGLERVDAEIMLFSFHQTDARPISKGAPPAPQLHTHTVIANLAWCPIDGKFRAIDWRGLDPLAYSTIYQTVLANELRAAGFTLRQGQASFEIATISDELITAFSPRSAQIKAAARELAIDRGLNPDELSTSQMKLLEREAQKNKVEKSAEFHELEACLPAWISQAGDLAPASVFGGDKADVEKCIQACKAELLETASSIAVVDRSKIDAIIAANILAIDQSRSEYDKLAKTLFDEFFIETMSERKMEQGEEAFDAESEGAEVPRAVSKLALDGERYALDASERLARADRGLPIEIDAALAKYSLTEEQATAIRAVANGKQLEFVRGGAGVGKTYAGAPLAAAHIDAGGTIYGTAVTNMIAYNLQEAGVPESHCMSLFKMAAMADQGKLKLDPNTMLLIDEASMVGLLDINKIFNAVEKSGARIVIVGDDSQIDAVGLQSLQLIQEGLSRAGADARNILTTIRQKNEIERAIANSFRNGIAVTDALDYMDANDRLKFGEDRAHTLKMCRAVWSKSRDDGANHVFIAPTNREAQEIALIVRAEREERQQLSGEEITLPTHGNGGDDADAENSMLLRTGDRIRFYDRVAEKSARGRPKNLCVNGTIARFLRIEGEGDDQHIVAEYLDKHDRPMKEPEALEAKARELANEMRSKKRGQEGWRNNQDWKDIPKKIRDSLLEQARNSDDVPNLQFAVPMNKIKDKESERYRLSYADASTVHSAQGISANRATAVSLDGTAQMNQKLAYVMASRHEHDFKIIANRQPLIKDLRSKGIKGELDREDLIAGLARSFTRETQRPFAVNVVDDVKLRYVKENSMSLLDIRRALNRKATVADNKDAADVNRAVEQTQPMFARLFDTMKSRSQTISSIADKFERAKDRISDFFEARKTARAADRVQNAAAERAIADTSTALSRITEAARERWKSIESLKKYVDRSLAALPTKTDKRDDVAAERAAASMLPAMKQLKEQSTRRRGYMQEFATLFDEAKDALRDRYLQAKNKIVGRRKDEAEIERAAAESSSAIEKLRDARTKNRNELQKVAAIIERQDDKLVDAIRDRKLAADLAKAPASQHADIRKADEAARQAIKNNARRAEIEAETEEQRLRRVGASARPR
jgi:conjugative relaxase-like TrwC/TraI family protein